MEFVLIPVIVLAIVSVFVWAFAKRQDGTVVRIQKPDGGVLYRIDLDISLEELETRKNLVLKVVNEGS